MEYIFFNIEDCMNQYLCLFDLKLLDLECKHVAYDCDEYKWYSEQSKKIGYIYYLFGKNNCEQENLRIKKQIDRINLYKDIELDRPIKIVISKDGKIWADNTHWTISYILKYGRNVVLKQVPFYIVDFRYNIARLISVNNSVLKSKTDRERTVEKAWYIVDRQENNWRIDKRKISIKNLMVQLKLY